MSIIIYKADVCPPSRAVLMVAEILELNYEAKEISCVAKENLKPEFTKKNPLHTVPVLEDGDFILVDSHAIMTYLVSKYGDKEHSKLYPAELDLRATIDQRLYFDATKIFPIGKAIIVAIVHEKATGASGKQIEEVEEGYKILENYLEESKFVACDYLTVADVSVVSTISALEVMVPINEKYKNIKAWMNRMKSEEWYQTTNVPGLNKLIELLNNCIKRNSEL